ncbi:MAG: glycoside hydrolase family 92 protein [Burkholderiales bacterium]|nr:glycoside hydrolase family 92 protein [Phycisphaerae bacterium]
MQSKAHALHDAADLVSLVEPRLGTNTGRWIAFSSACRPFGMVNLSPDTRIDGDWGCGYKYADNRIIGFSHIHAWQISGILVMPTTGAADPAQGADEFASDFSHDDEVCQPGYHRVNLQRCSITAELTATQRVGVHRYHFPAGASASIYIDLASTLGPCAMGGAALKQTGPRTLQGFVINEPTIRKPKRLTIYFAIELDRDVELSDFNPDAIRALINLGNVSEPVTMKVAISYTSIAAAWDNLRAEAADLTFDEIKASAQREWNDWLRRIEVEGGTETQRARFYTDLYFSLLGRRVVSDVAGTYIDNTGDAPTVRQIPCDAAGKPRYQHHNSDSFWGAQWSITPLWAIAYPQLIDDFCRCFFDMYKNGGLIPRGPAGGNYTFVMTSAQTTPLYAAAINTGIYKPDDVEAVYHAVRKNHFPGGLMSKCGYEHHTCIGGGIEDYIARGYIPEDLPKAGFHNNGAAQTIEHAWNDWALAQLAITLGKTADAELFRRRSQNWRNLFDPKIGFCRPRNRDGTWLEPFDPWQRRGWTEANAWTYTFNAPHDVAGAVELFGSRERFLARLEEAFQKTREKGFFVAHEHHQEIPLDFGNEPALPCVHLFHAAGDARRTQYWLTQVLDNLKSGNAPTDSFGGDEDQGIMGAWNVLIAIGLFSIDGAAGATPTYQITAPLFDRVTIHLDPAYFPGRTFTITATPRHGCAGRYVDRAEYDGKTLQALQINHSDIARGGNLLLELAD